MRQQTLLSCLLLGGLFGLTGSSPDTRVVRYPSYTDETSTVTTRHEHRWLADNNNTSVIPTTPPSRYQEIPGSSVADQCRLTTYLNTSLTETTLGISERVASGMVFAVQAPSTSGVTLLTMEFGVFLETFDPSLQVAIYTRQGRDYLPVLTESSEWTLVNKATSETQVARTTDPTPSTPFRILSPIVMNPVVIPANAYQTFWIHASQPVLRTYGLATNNATSEGVWKQDGILTSFVGYATANTFSNDNLEDLRVPVASLHYRVDRSCPRVVQEMVHVYGFATASFDVTEIQTNIETAIKQVLTTDVRLQELTASSSRSVVVSSVNVAFRASNNACSEALRRIITSPDCQVVDATIGITHSVLWDPPLLQAELVEAWTRNDARTIQWRNDYGIAFEGPSPLAARMLLTLTGVPANTLLNPLQRQYVENVLKSFLNAQVPNLTYRVVVETQAIASARRNLRGLQGGASTAVIQIQVNVFGLQQGVTEATYTQTLTDTFSSHRNAFLLMLQNQHNRPAVVNANGNTDFGTVFSQLFSASFGNYTEPPTGDDDDPQEEDKGTTSTNQTYQILLYVFSALLGISTIYLGYRIYMDYIYMSEEDRVNNHKLDDYLADDNMSIDGRSLDGKSIEGTAGAGWKRARSKSRERTRSKSRERTRSKSADRDILLSDIDVKDKKKKKKGKKKKKKKKKGDADASVAGSVRSSAVSRPSLTPEQLAAKTRELEDKWDKEKAEKSSEPIRGVARAKSADNDLLFGNLGDTANKPSNVASSMPVSSGNQAGANGRGVGRAKSMDPDDLFFTGGAVPRKSTASASTSATGNQAGQSRGVGRAKSADGDLLFTSSASTPQNQAGQNGRGVGKSKSADLDSFMTARRVGPDGSIHGGVSVDGGARRNRSTHSASGSASVDGSVRRRVPSSARSVDGGGRRPRNSSGDSVAGASTASGARRKGGKKPSRNSRDDRSMASISESTSGGRPRSSRKKNSSSVRNSTHSSSGNSVASKRSTATSSTKQSRRSIIRQDTKTGRMVFESKGRKIYEFEQSDGSLKLFIGAPPFVKSQGELACIIQSNHIKLGLQGSSKWFIDEDTFGTVDPKGSTWSLGNENGKGVIIVSLKKATPGIYWDAALKGKSK